MKKKIIAAVLVITVFIIIFILHTSVKPRAYVAFVIDDWGYNDRYIHMVRETERPLTISILPNLRYSRYVAEQIREQSSLHDIILHLPLESETDLAAEVDTIRSEMEEKEILAILKDNIENMPSIVGVSNHQGSKATEDKRVMKIIMKELKKRDLFFLDSLTTPDSVCSDIAHEVGLRYAERDVFLDITDQTDSEHFYSYIKNQIKELSRIALKRGAAVGVGHNIEITLKAIKDSIPMMEKEGIEIVPLKKIVR